MHTARAAARNILIIFLTAILLLNLYLVVVQVVLHNELPKLFGMTQIIVISGSMEPVVRVGDILLIREQSAYETGDVVTYRSGSSLITHRVIETDGTGLVTQGDANNAADAPIELSQVEGQMLLRIPKLGYAALMLRTPLGFLITIAGGLLLIIVPTLADRRRKSKQD